MEMMLVGSMISALATGVGAIPILFFRHINHHARDTLVALTAGIMMAASVFSLIPEAVNMSNLYVLAFGMLLGTTTLMLIERYLPHVDLENPNNKLPIDSQALLIISAITVHNLPEGLSVGVSYTGNNAELGGLIALAIGLQNAPEGFLVALFLVNQNINRWTALAVATLTGSVEILSGIIGYGLTSYVKGLVPYGLSFAAGAMLFIVYKELIPESHGHGYERSATYAFIIGLISMLFLIHYFG
ncbi:ZIP family metal transporter [Aneurinibacillus migulanus]|uniref:Dihydroorotate dehydrogenase n=1 Tax=Aneurinibacillus migulanus TaxID=47500 RepID=A0A0D1XUE4_ANEMI|nr:ZIP family metal transporter [Aneurinibacillus migulanus]KIV50722.1 dihydroorotate dehydrogenase [Aneurinibacillus migulanus]KON99355.1 dihydroorotate dehydrogenase [Aneurinibacillus migulanus]MED0893192.1 ZIP family metal transporter [Aneurinibacillus migulanus]MED1615503.1 ZIP family metal transporter [Aneurinibacillus migulanus]SDI54615.1 zinc transporter, ZIP family [Aneurinibacillus migulanus]